MRDNQEFKKQLISRSFQLSKAIITLSDKFPNKRSSWVVADQFVRAGTSVGANIIEAQAASSKKDFTNFLAYSLKSANESKYWPGLLKDSRLLDSEKIDPLMNEVNELAKMLAVGVLRLKGKKTFDF